MPKARAKSELEGLYTFLYMEIQYQPYFPKAVMTNICPFLLTSLRKASFRPGVRQALRYITCSYPLVQGERTKGVLSVGYAWPVMGREWVHF